MFRQKDTLDMHVYSKNISQNIYMYVQVARYLGHTCIQQNTSQKYMYVQVAKYLMEKKREQKESEQEKNKKEEKKQKIKNNKGCLAKKQHACEKR